MREPVDEQAELDRTRAQTFAEQSEPYETQGGVAGAMAAVPTFGPAVEPGEVGVLGPYRIIKQLGKGGMGAVYAALDTRLDRKIAIKVMLPSFAAIPSAKERFLREARAAAKVSHDNVVTVFEADERHGIPYIAMQYLEGYPLDEYLKKKGEIDLPQILRIARETAAGLEAAHKLGLIHRDIKPGNLWLEAPNGRVKLLDFGLARPVDSDIELTKSGAVVGTPAYMSPEQGQGERVDARSDLFSLGVMLYRLSTGQLPFQGNTTMAVLMALGTKEPVPVRSLKPELPEGFARLVHDLLAKDPDRRPQSATDVIRRLRDLGRNPNSLPVASMPQVSMIDAGPAPSYVPIPIGMASMANPFENIDITDSVTVEPKPKAQPKDAKPANRKPYLIGGVLAALLLLLGGVIIVIRNKDGTETKIEVPDGSTVTVKDKGGKTLAKVGPAKNANPKPTTPVSARAGLALDGDTLITVSDKPILESGKPFTWEATVTPTKIDASAPYQSVIRMGGQTGLSFRDNVWQADVGSHNFIVFSTTKVDLNRTIQLAYTYDGTKHYLFLDGKLAASSAPPPSAITIFDMGDRFVGTFHEIRISNTCRYTKTYSPPPALTKDDTTLALYLFNEGSGNRLTDHSGNGHHGTIRNGRWVAGDPDRKAAEWVLSVGGSVQVNGVNIKITALTELPTDRFVLTNVNLYGNKKITDEDLANLKALTGVLQLDLGHTPVTDAGMIHFKNYMKLQQLTLNGTSVTDAGLANFQNCRQLTSVRLLYLPVTDTGLGYFQNCEGLKELILSKATLTNAGYMLLGKYLALENLEIHGLAPTKAQLEQFQTLKNLKYLNLKGNQIARNDLDELHAAIPQCRIAYDGGSIEAVDVDRKAAEWVLSKGGYVRINGNTNSVKSAAELPKDRFTVAWADLTKTKVTDKELAQLQELKGLVWLSLGNTAVTDAGLVQLQELKGLAHIRLYGTSVSDTGMVLLKEIKGLTYLDLNYTKVSDAGLKHIQELQKLTELHLNGTQTTDVGLKHIAEVKKLTRLDLRGTKVTTKGLETLHAAVPGCRIEHDNGVIEAVDRGRQAPSLPAGKTGLRFAMGDMATATKVPVRPTTLVTIEAWLTVEAVQDMGGRELIRTPNGSINTNDGRFRMYSFHGHAEAADRIPIGRRVHVAAVNDGKKRNLYLDGKRIAESEDAGIPVPEHEQEALGEKLTVIALGSDLFTGTIDAVRVSTTAKYEKDFPPPEVFAKDKDTLALYLFDEGQGDTLKDSSGNGYHAKIIGAKWVKGPNVVAAADGLPGLRVDEKDTFTAVTVPSLKLTGDGPLTLEGYVKMDHPRAGENPVFFGWNYQYIMVPSGLVHFTAGKNGEQWKQNPTATPDELPRGIWHHLAAVRDGKQNRLYVDGKLVARNDVAEPIQPANEHTGLFVIGSICDGVTIREVRVSKVPRYSGDKFTPAARHQPDKDTLVLYHCDDGRGNVLTDSSGNGYHGKLTGGKWVVAADVDRQAARWVLSIGGKVQVNGLSREIGNPRELPKERFLLTGFNLEAHPKVTDAWLANLKDCQDLTMIGLYQTSIGDAGLAHLKNCKQVKVLSLGGTKITNAGLALFKDCKELTWLGLFNTPITDDGIAPFTDCKNLKILDLNTTKITDAGLATFKNCKNLTTLYLNNTKVTDAGLAYFKDCKNLTGLFLDNTPISEAGLALFKDHKDLMQLGLNKTDIGDAGLAPFKECKGLNYLGLRKTKITRKAIEEFHAAVPGCKIEHDDGVIEPTKK